MNRECDGNRLRIAFVVPPLSLIGIVRLITTLLLLPAVGVWAGVGTIYYVSQDRAEQAQRMIQRIDDRISQSATLIASPPLGVDPCSDDGRQWIQLTGELSIDFVRESGRCVWRYVESVSRHVIALDNWDTSYRLEKREYIQAGEVIAEDDFTARTNDCFKRRKIFDDASRLVIDECYSEAGIAHNKCYRLAGGDCDERRNSLRSPIPPMVQWFFYR